MSTIGDTSNGTALPTFDHPPVSEVVLGIQFADPVLDDVVLLADFLPSVRDAFPQLEKHPPLAKAVEAFGDTPPTTTFDIQFGSEAPPVRYWFVSESGNDLIQAQQDRFVVNWRQVRAADEYPRYPHLRERFEREYGAIHSAVGEERWARATVDWCEVSYINRVPAELDGNRTQLSDILEVVQPFSSEARSVIPEVEDSNFQARFLLPPLQTDGDPSGRFYVLAGPGTHGPTQEKIYALTFLYRGRPSGQGLEELLDFFDRGREVIVKSFKELTTRRMHELWGLRGD